MASNKKLAIGIVVAAAAGYVAGVLTAPKSGRETRQDIKDAAIKTKRQLEEQLKKLHGEASRLIKLAETQLVTVTGRAKTELKQSLEKAKASAAKAKDVLSALHEGEADDEDLDRAVKDLKASLDGLKKYAGK